MSFNLFTFFFFYYLRIENVYKVKKNIFINTQGDRYLRYFLEYLWSVSIVPTPKMFGGWIWWAACNADQNIAWIGHLSLHIYNHGVEVHQYIVVGILADRQYICSRESTGPSYSVGISPMHSGPYWEEYHRILLDCCNETHLHEHFLSLILSLNRHNTHCNWFLLSYHKHVIKRYFIVGSWQFCLLLHILNRNFVEIYQLYTNFTLQITLNSSLLALDVMLWVY